MRSFISIYALAVCFATLMCFVVALGIFLYDIVQIAAPSFTLAYYQPYQSNDAFRQNHPDKKDEPDNEVTRLRQQALDDAFNAERRTASQSAVFVFIILVINVVVFAVHWRIARRERPGAQPDMAA